MSARVAGMHLSRWFLLTLALLTPLSFAGTAEEAAKIKQRYKLTSETWELQVKTAPNDEARRELWKKRPDVRESAFDMWTCIRSSLSEDWTLEPAGWLMRVAPNVIDAGPDGKPKALLAPAVAAIRDAVEKYHLRSPKLAPICLGLVANQDPTSLALLEKIEAQNPDARVQGVAALGQAMLLKGFGDSQDVMKKRLNLLRKSIIQSADVEIDGLSVARMADDELYIIRYLTKGREAPDLSGTDSGGRPMKLSDYRGKVVVLLFWGSTSVPDLDHMLELTTAMQTKYAGKSFALIGVNNDTTETLRALQAEDARRVTWPNFSDPLNKLAEEFRIGARPIAYVLDGDRRIQFVGTPGSFIELTVDGLLANQKVSPQK